MSGSANFIQFTNGPVVGMRLMTADTALPAGRNIQLVCSADAVVTLTLSNGTTGNVYPQAGTGPADNIYPYSCTKYHVVSGTIVAAYALD